MSYLYDGSPFNKLQIPPLDTFVNNHYIEHKVGCMNCTKLSKIVQYNVTCQQYKYEDKENIFTSALFCLKSLINHWHTPIRKHDELVYDYCGGMTNQYKRNLFQKRSLVKIILNQDQAGILKFTQMKFMVSEKPVHYQN